MENLKKWYKICLEEENVASEILNGKDARKELSVHEIRELLKIFGEDKFVEVLDDGKMKIID